MMRLRKIIWLSCRYSSPPACWKENMGSQPKAKPMQESVFFADGTTARPLVEGTVARGDLELDSHLYRGFVDGKPATTFPEHYPTEADGPFPTSGPQLARSAYPWPGLNSRSIAPCATAMPVTATASSSSADSCPPPSYRLDRLRQAPVGHIFDVITNGYGAMYSYGDRISPADRWAIVAYIRTLQMSQAIPAQQLDAAQMRQLGESR